MNRPDPATRRSRLALIGLAALFFVPLALSFFLYYGTSWRPDGGTQHGELISPPRPLPEVALPGSGGAPFLRERWHLVQLSDGPCDADCRATLVTTRQVRLALDKDVARVARVLLSRGVPVSDDTLASQHPDLVLAAPAGGEGERLLAAFPGMPAGGVFIVDPLGNLMMSYPGDVRPKDLLADLERLLKLSHIG